MDIRINTQRLWSRLMAMAELGATDQGGVCRLALSDLDEEGRQLLIAWSKPLGLQARHDRLGNLFLRREGTDAQRLPIVMGSHLDSQPTGGKFDGVYGVIAALEVIETLAEHGADTAAPLEIAVWTNEEGARFSPAMLGSGYFAGVFDEGYAIARQDNRGVTIAQELQRLGYEESTLPANHELGAFLEAHIEQGPILEKEDLEIGIVTGVQGIRWYDVTVSGVENHAGPFPMSGRRDPVRSSAALISSLYELVDSWDDDARITIGDISARPGSRNTVPGSVHFTLDLRHPNSDSLARMDEQARALIEAVKICSATVEEIWYSPPVAFDARCIDAVRDATVQCDYQHRSMVSGAGHDAVYLSRVCPTAMIFTPCRGGMSHNPAEYASAEQLARGANVLLHSAWALAR